MKVSSSYMGKNKKMSVEVINCKKIKDRDDLYSKLAEKLSFPDYFGKNLDALFDVLTDPSVTGEKTILVFVFSSALEQSLGDYAERVIRTLEDADYESENFKFLRY